MGKGGWRWGAGRPAYRGKVEACLRLDVRQMHRDGCLQPGRGGTWSWRNTSTGEHSGSIGYRVGEGFISLSYSLNGDSRAQWVPIRRTACNYGGTRPWFACPHCDRRVAVLCMRRGGFYCRQCAQVSYYSQSEDALDRTWRRQRKAEAKLGEHWQRPKGMHHATRKRLLATIFECEESRDAALCAWVAAHSLWLT